MKKKRELKVVVNEGDLVELNKKVAEITLDIFKRVCPKELQLEAINMFRSNYEATNNQKLIS